MQEQRVCVSVVFAGEDLEHLRHAASVAGLNYQQIAEIGAKAQVASILEDWAEANKASFAQANLPPLLVPLGLGDVAAGEESRPAQSPDDRASRQNQGGRACSRMSAPACASAYKPLRAMPRLRMNREDFRFALGLPYIPRLLALMEERARLAREEEMILNDIFEPRQAAEVADDVKQP